MDTMLAVGKRERSKRGRPHGKDVVQESETHTTDATEERRKLRARYRDLKSSLADDKDELARSDSSKFDKLFGQMESLHELVEKPREQIADAELFLDITAGLLEVAKGARCKNGMSPSEFVSALMHNFGGSTVDWNLLGMTTGGIFCEAPGVFTMVGPMDIEVKQRKVQERRKRDRPTQKTRVQEVEGEGKEDGETDSNMLVMFKILSEFPNGVELDRLVLSRQSFSQSVENIFCMSFLVKDGRAQIAIKDGRHFVVAKNAPSHEERGRGQGLIHNTQFVFRYDWNDWEYMKESVEEGSELMPLRGDAGERTPVANPIRTPIRKTSRNRARETPLHGPLDEEDEGVMEPRKIRGSLRGTLRDVDI
ncbi:hypothetical protein R1flu_024121 [Riccia fluitans]|uniref:Non-structural maintenance of chromosomes element 4 n=1 Tax=Riccia fluitans TaxID=41844 RepID=A0ABD1XU30_9MARC